MSRRVLIVGAGASLAGLMAAAELGGREWTAPPRTSALGALLAHITGDAEADVDPRVGPADRAGMPAGLVSGEPQHVGRGFRQPVPLHEIHAMRLPCLGHVIGQRRTAHETDAQRAEGGRVEARIVGEQPVLGGDPHHRGHAAILDELEDA